MTELRLVIFDVDGTLVDSQAEILASMTATFAQSGLPAPSRADILGIVGLSLPEALAVLAPDQSAAERAEMVACYRQSYFDRRQVGGADAGSPLFPHARAVLNALHAEDTTLLGLATGKSRRGLDALLEAHDLRPLFVTRQCSDDHPSKPHPSMVLRALAETGVAPSRAVMVGDTEYDIEMARAAGIAAIGVDWGYHDRGRLGGARTVIGDMRHLLAALDDLWGTTA